MPAIRPHPRRITTFVCPFCLWTTPHYIYSPIFHNPIPEERRIWVQCPYPCYRVFATDALLLAHQAQDH